MEPDPHCRIGRIRRKDGGAVVRLVPSEERTPEWWHARVTAPLREQHARGQRLAGFALVWWTMDGDLCADYCHTGASRWPAQAVPRIAHEALTVEVARVSAFTTVQMAAHEGWL